MSAKERQLLLENTQLKNLLKNISKEIITTQSPAYQLGRIQGILNIGSIYFPDIKKPDLSPASKNVGG